MTEDQALDVLGKWFAWVDSVDGPGGLLMLDMNEDDMLALHPDDCVELAQALLTIASAKMLTVTEMKT